MAGRQCGTEGERKKDKVLHSYGSVEGTIIRVWDLAIVLCYTPHAIQQCALHLRLYIYTHTHIYKLAYAPQSRRRSAYSGPMITHDGRLPGMQFAVAYAPCHASSAVGQRTLSLSPIPSRPVGHVVSHTSKAGEFCMMTLTVSIHRYIYNAQLSSERWAEAVNIP